MEFKNVNQLESLTFDEEQNYAINFFSIYLHNVDITEWRKSLSYLFRNDEIRDMLLQSFLVITNTPSSTESELLLWCFDDSNKLARNLKLEFIQKYLEYKLLHKSNIFLFAKLCLKDPELMYLYKGYKMIAEGFYKKD